MLIATLHYLPSVAYFRNIAKAQNLTIEQHDHWQKASYRNRCKIAAANGALMLSIPVLGGREQKTPYQDVQINYSEKWQHIHWQSICSAYNSSPFFEHYASYFAPIFEQKWDSLFAFNLTIFQLLLRILKLEINLQFTDSYEKEYSDKQDLRPLFLPSKKVQTIPPYHQVFEEKNGFIADVSIIDLLFNEGPQAGNYLREDIS